MQPHSAEYFGDQRDFWWNRDFVELMAKRWRLSEVTRALEVGSGVGHWSRVLEPHLPHDALLCGVELEPRWVSEARRRAEALGLAQRLTYQQGDAMALPFADQTFDLVTCQTVLIHLPDVMKALRGMLRVLKPGGLLAVVEPNNIGCSLVVGSTRFDDDVESLVNLAKLQIVCERGKAALGEGHNSVGELLPGYFQELGLSDLQVYQSDHASPLVPPYETLAERANVSQFLDWVERDFHCWSRGETRRYYLGGGGSEADFDALWAQARRVNQRVASALRAKTEHQTGGSLVYLVSARKPHENAKRLLRTP